MANFFKKIFGLENPADAGREHLDQVQREGKKYYNPYISEGSAVRGDQRDRYSAMADDPSSLLNALMGQYSESPFYQKNREDSLRAARGSAAAGGVLGTRDSQQDMMNLSNTMAMGDQQQWLQNALGVKDRGLGGIDSYINRGYDSSSKLADYLGSALGQQAAAEMGGQASQNENYSALTGAIIQAAAMAAGMPMTENPLKKGKTSNSGNSSGMAGPGQADMAMRAGQMAGMGGSGVPGAF